MIQLENRVLRVDVLDPTVESARQGTRYCRGGYVWQIHDRMTGPRLSGPEWPAPEPTAFNGQGLPESFRHRTRSGEPLTWQGKTGVAIGIGALALDAHDAVVVEEKCPWAVERRPHQLVFRTAHAAAGFAYSLERSLNLRGRTLTSASRLTNTGRLPLAVQWFAHPFFPLGEGRTFVDLPATTTLPENPGFALDGRRLTFKRRFTRPEDDQFALLGLPPGQPLRATLSSPGVPAIRIRTSFAPDECPVWANARTFSIEPYQNLSLQPGEARAWTVSYTLEPAKA